MRWVLTVASEMNSWAAVSRLLAPWATSSSTSSSRWLIGSTPGARIWPITRVATDGESTASPPAAQGCADPAGGLGPGDAVGQPQDVHEDRGRSRCVGDGDVDVRVVAVGLQ